MLLRGYETPVDGQRNRIQDYRQEILEGEPPERDRRIRLRTIDDTWADYLAQVAEYKSGVQLLSGTGRDSHHAYLLAIHEWFGALQAGLEEEMARRLQAPGDEYANRGAVWAYLTTDQPTNQAGHGLSRSLRDLAAIYLFR